jgi:hypothetical protein
VVETCSAIFQIKYAAFKVNLHKIKIDLRAMGLKSVKWIRLSQDKVQRRDFVKTNEL